jgi:hypothetical protein
MTPAVYIGPSRMLTCTWSALVGVKFQSRCHPIVLKQGTRGRYRLRGFKLSEFETEVAYFYPTEQPACSNGAPACVALETAFLMRSEVDLNIIEETC